MRVLLTGASGFLGRHTSAVLEQRYGAGNVTGVSFLATDLGAKRLGLLHDLSPDSKP